MALKWLRDKIKYLQWVLWIIVVTFVVALFFDYGTIDPTASAANDPAAWIGDEEISYAEFKTTYGQLEGRYRQMFGAQWSEDMATQFGLRKQALDSLIDRRILLMEAERIGLRASDEEVQRAILEIPAFQNETGGFIGREKMVNVLRQNRIDEAEFGRQMREDVLIQKLNDVLRHTAYVPNSAVERAFRDEVERAEIRFVKVPASQFAGQTSVSDTDLESYYAENSAAYELPERRVIDYLLVENNRIRNGIEVPEAEARAFYDSHRDDFTREEQVRARHILFQVGPERTQEQAMAEARSALARVEAGEDFATLARELSDDEGSARRGGDLGMFGRGAMVKPFEDAAFGAEVGSIVGPVETDFGAHLILVEDHREGGLRAFEEVQKIASTRIAGEQAAALTEERANELAQTLAAGEAVDRAAFQALAEDEPVLSFQTSDPFGPDDPITGLGRSPQVSEAAYALAPGGVSDPIQVPRGWVVLRVHEVEAPRVPTLEEVGERVRREVEAEKQQELASERLAAALSEVGDGGLEAIASRFGVEVESSEEFGRSDTVAGLGRDRAVIDAALDMEVGEMSESIATADGAVVFEVTERTTFDPAEFEERRDDLRDQVTGTRFNQVIQALIELRKRDLAPRYHQPLAEEFAQGTAGPPGAARTAAL